MLRERSETKEKLKSVQSDKSARSKFVSMDKSAQHSISQKKGKQIAQNIVMPERSKKQRRQEEASYVVVDRVLHQDTSQVQSLKKNRSV